MHVFPNPITYLGLVKLLHIRKLLTNGYKSRPVLLFCKHALSPADKKWYGVCTSRFTCQQRYNKTLEETEINFLPIVLFS